MSSPPSERRKRRQAQRRQKRTVLQNDLVLRGWVPVKYGSCFGIYSHQHNQLVLRRWYIGMTGMSPAPTATSITTSPVKTNPRGGAWRYQCSVPWPLPFEPDAEITWNELQSNWMYALRAAAIERGWL